MTDLIVPPKPKVLDSIGRSNSQNGRSGNPLPPSLQASAELQFLYNHLNEHLFGGELPQCMVVYTRKARCFGYFAPDRFRNLDGDLVPELGLNPTYLSVFGDLEACKTVAHEQAHVARYFLGPLNRNGRRSRTGYHDRHWGTIMRQIGLMPSHTGKPDGKKTGYQMMEYIIEGGLFERVCKDLFARGFKLNWGDNVNLQSRDAAQGAGDPSVSAAGAKPTKKDRIKFTCPRCGLNAWAKPSAEFSCAACFPPMRPENLMAIARKAS